MPNKGLIYGQYRMKHFQMFWMMKKEKNSCIGCFFSQVSSHNGHNGYVSCILPRPDVLATYNLYFSYTAKHQYMLYSNCRKFTWG